MAGRHFVLGTAALCALGYDHDRSEPAIPSAAGPAPATPMGSAGGSDPSRLFAWLDRAGETDDVAAEEEAVNGVRAYDLGRQERIVRGRMPTLELINERFARYRLCRTSCWQVY